MYILQNQQWVIQLICLTQSDIVFGLVDNGSQEDISVLYNLLLQLKYQAQSDIVTPHKLVIEYSLGQWSNKSVFRGK